MPARKRRIACGTGGFRFTRETAMKRWPILDSVERFEVVVESHGGDLLVDRIGSSQPDDAAFVLPARDLDESVTDYRFRLEAATDRLRRRRKA